VPIVYGINPLLEQLAADPSKIVHIYLLKGRLSGQLGRLARQAREEGVAVTFVDRKALNRMAGEAAHQGAVADLSKPVRLVLLDGVQDPRNLGSIVRTAVCAGADGIIIPKRNAAGMTAAAVKASAGGAATARIARVVNLSRVLDELRKLDIWSVAIDAKGEREVGSLDPSLDYAFLFGGEGRGISRLLREKCDISARIPMRGPLGSLNVAVAVGVTLFSTL